MPAHYKKQVGETALFKYTEENRLKAIRDVTHKKSFIRKIAEKYNVQKSTLNDRVRGVRKKKFGGQPTLSPEIESYLAEGRFLHVLSGTPCYHIQDFLSSLVKSVMILLANEN